MNSSLQILLVGSLALVLVMSCSADDQSEASSLFSNAVAKPEPEEDRVLQLEERAFAAITPDEVFSSLRELAGLPGQPSPEFLTRLSDSRSKVLYDELHGILLAYEDSTGGISWTRNFYQVSSGNYIDDNGNPLPGGRFLGFSTGETPRGPMYIARREAVDAFYAIVVSVDSPVMEDASFFVDADTLLPRGR